MELVMQNNITLIIPAGKEKTRWEVIVNCSPIQSGLLKLKTRHDSDHGKGTRNSIDHRPPTETQLMNFILL